MQSATSTLWPHLPLLTSPNGLLPQKMEMFWGVRGCSAHVRRCSCMPCTTDERLRYIEVECVTVQVLNMMHCHFSFRSSSCLCACLHHSKQGGISVCNPQISCSIWLGFWLILHQEQSEVAAQTGNWSEAARRYYNCPRRFVVRFGVLGSVVQRHSGHLPGRQACTLN